MKPSTVMGAAAVVFGGLGLALVFGVLVATSVAREATAPAGWVVAAVFGLVAVGFGWILFGRGSPTTGATGPGASGS
ncbi:MAG: hypothetical protein RJQ04_22300 [Longimicrobiales bacterium]